MQNALRRTIFCNKDNFLKDYPHIDEFYNKTLDELRRIEETLNSVKYEKINSEEFRKLILTEYIDIDIPKDLSLSDIKIIQIFLDYGTSLKTKIIDHSMKNLGLPSYSNKRNEILRIFLYE